MITQLLLNKKKLHETMLILQPAVIFNQLVIYEYFIQFYPEGAIFTKFVQFILIGILNVIHITFISFILKKRVFIIYTVLLFANYMFFSFGISFLTVGEVFNNFLLRIAFEMGIVCFLVQMLFFFIVVLKDSFDAEGYNLASAANAFIMIPITFSFIYLFLEVVQPGMLGIEKTQITHITQASLQFSCYTIAGIDHLTPNANPLLKNIAAIESIFASLYLVLLVGRIIKN